MRPVAAFMLVVVSCLFILFLVNALDLAISHLETVRGELVNAAQQVGVNVTLHDYAGHARSVVGSLLWAIPAGCLAMAVVVLIHTRLR